MWVLNFLGRPVERRRSRRIGVRGLVAYYWTGAVPGPRDVREIGLYGARIAAPERFYPGTLVQMLLEDRALENDGPPHQACVYAKAVRPADDGFCVEFLFGDAAERKKFWRFLGELTMNGPKEPASPAESNGAEAEPVVSEDAEEPEARHNGDGSAASSSEGEEETERIDEPEANRGPAIGEGPGPENAEGPGRHMAMDHKESVRGQALIEFALILPLLFLLILNVVNFGGFLYAWITVGNSARTGAQYMILGGAMVGSPSPPEMSAVQAFVLEDLKSLPNYTTAQVTVCTRTPSSSSLSTSVACLGPGTFSPPVDSSDEAFHYSMASVDVVYNYTPFIRFWDFTNLGIHLTLPPMTVHRQAAMRRML